MNEIEVGQVWRNPIERWDKRITQVGPKTVTWRWVGNPFLSGSKTKREPIGKFVGCHQRKDAG